MNFHDSYLEDCLNRKIIFFTGKGGTGKSSLAWATAIACQKKGKQVTVASWSRYSDSLASIPTFDVRIEWIPLETLSAFHEYALHLLKFEKIYDVVFENQILKIFILAAPGLSETVIAGKIWDLWHEKKKELIIVDMPSSGHAISFFQSPLGVKKIFHIGIVHKNTVRICEMFSDPETRIDLVALAEELPITESLELKQKLSVLHPFHFGFVHINQMTPELALPTKESLEALAISSRRCLERHMNHLVQEKNLVEMANRMELPILKIPRLATENQTKTVTGLADILEKM